MINFDNNQMHKERFRIKNGLVSLKSNISSNDPS